MNTEKPGLHLGVYKWQGRWRAEIHVKWVGWTDNLRATRDTHPQALGWGLRVMRRLAE